jgi:hypothetical protein
MIEFFRLFVRKYRNQRNPRVAPKLPRNGRIKSAIWAWRLAGIEQRVCAANREEGT